jgi:hypothetical protein
VGSEASRRLVELEVRNVETAIGVDPVELVEPSGQILVIVEQFFG